VLYQTNDMLQLRSSSARRLFSIPKRRLLESSNIDFVEQWVIYFSKNDAIFLNAKTVAGQDLWSELRRLERWTSPPQRVGHIYEIREIQAVVKKRYSFRLLRLDHQFQIISIQNFTKRIHGYVSAVLFNLPKSCQADTNMLGKGRLISCHHLSK
jgi:hypothetical protein